MSRRAGDGCYAHVEREQRWLLRSVPDGATNERVIVDHYWHGTTLRLRMVEDANGAVYKLGQKVRVNDDDPAVVHVTNFYLSASEFDQLSVTPALIIAKSRWSVTANGVQLSIDEFKGRHAGLVVVVAEVELGQADALLSAPPFAGSEVTHDNEYSGGWLARASEADLYRVIERSRDT